MSRLALYDVADAEKFCSAIVGRTGLELSYHEAEDLAQYLLATAWEISLTFQPERSSVGFSTYAGHVLRRRAYDWLRQKNGRSIWKFKDRVHERPRPQLVSLDGTERDRLEQSLIAGDGDREAGGDLGLPGLVSGGDWQRARDLEILGLEPDGRTAG